MRRPRRYLGLALIALAAPVGAREVRYGQNYKPLTAADPTFDKHLVDYPAFCHCSTGNAALLLVERVLVLRLPVARDAGITKNLH